MNAMLTKHNLIFLSCRKSLFLQRTRSKGVFSRWRQSLTPPTICSSYFPYSVHCRLKRLLANTQHSLVAFPPLTTKRLPLWGNVSDFRLLVIKTMFWSYSKRFSYVPRIVFCARSMGGPGRYLKCLIWTRSTTVAYKDRQGEFSIPPGARYITNKQSKILINWSKAITVMIYTTILHRKNIPRDAIQRKSL